MFQLNINCNGEVMVQVADSVIDAVGKKIQEHKEMKGEIWVFRKAF